MRRWASTGSRRDARWWWCWRSTLNELVIHTDPARPHAWRREPYYSDIRRWARAAARKGLQVVVWEDDRKIVIAPDRPALGEMGQFAP